METQQTKAAFPHRAPRASGVLSSRATVAAFHAFRTLYRDRYLAYANACLGSPVSAEQAVSDTLTALAVNWSMALGRPHPAAVAWQLLCECVESASGRHTATPACCPQSRCRSEAAVLHDQLHMSNAAAADLMGLTQSEFLLALKAAKSASCPRRSTQHRIFSD